MSIPSPCPVTRLTNKPTTGVHSNHRTVNVRIAAPEKKITFHPGATNCVNFFPDGALKLIWVALPKWNESTLNAGSMTFTRSGNSPLIALETFFFPGS